jgi:hypothetical protein
MGLNQLAKSHGLQLESADLQRALQKAGREWLRIQPEPCALAQAANWLALVDQDPNFYGLLVRSILEDKGLEPPKRLQAARSLLELAFQNNHLIYHSLLALAYVALRNGLTRNQGHWVVMALATSHAQHQFRSAAEAQAFLRIVLRSPEISPKDRALIVGLMLSDPTLAPSWGGPLLQTVIETRKVERKVLRNLCRRVVEGGEPLAGLRPTLALQPLKSIAEELGDDMEPEVLLAVSLMRQNRQDRLALFGIRAFPDRLGREAVVALAELGDDVATLLRWALTRGGKSERSTSAALGALDVMEKDRTVAGSDTVARTLLQLAAAHASADVRQTATRLASQFKIRMVAPEATALRQGVAAAK